MDRGGRERGLFNIAVPCITHRRIWCYAVFFVGSEKRLAASRYVVFTTRLRFGAVKYYVKLGIRRLHTVANSLINCGATWGFVYPGRCADVEGPAAARGLREWYSTSWDQGIGKRITGSNGCRDLVW